MPATSTLNAIPSPCTGVCSIDPATGWCAGCLRTIDEISAWGGLDAPARRAVWASLAARRAERDRQESAAGASQSAVSGTGS